MQKSFYVPDDKKELLEKIQDLTDESSLSSAIMEALEYYIENNRNISEEERRLRELKDMLNRANSELESLKKRREDLETRIEERREAIKKLTEEFSNTKEKVESEEEVIDI